MKEASIKQAVADFYKSGETSFKKEFSIVGVNDEIFTVTINRKKLNLRLENFSLEARSNTISAYPSGATCGCCNGSGRSS